MDGEAELFYRQLPKVELHAHLNGSVSVRTIDRLIGRKPHLNIQHSMTAIGKGQRRTLDECFQVFKVIHQLVDTEEDILMVATDVIREFAADSVKYLELRSTPREEKNTGLTKKGYIETVIRAIQLCKDEGLDIDVRFLVAIDRRNGTQVAMETVALAEQFLLSSDGLVVGLDLSGDPTVQSQLEETDLLLNLPPNRIGHGTFLHPEVGGSQNLVDKVLKNSIPLELCLTSNVKGQTVPSYSQHHFKYWYQLGHPSVICTDDKGVFSTDLSQEYQLAASTFGLSHAAMWKLSQQAIDCIFAPETVKQQLRQKWTDLQPQLFQ
ncbi:N6-Methyl-AMP deaminase isoform X2 [Echeneis naucrates]|uniref:N6-Methyl-AMP deaminase isoform X2 n=1 Tax=Echeneis naucrates TaxID=173247 RepID=UPI001113DFB9|nr:adenosine deaminase-like protein isoform X2 [Echeneis naucrates]